VIQVPVRHSCVKKKHIENGVCLPKI